MEVNALIRAIAARAGRIFGDGFVGVYVHGSICFGCFNPLRSDVDFIIVLSRAPSQTQKETLIRALVRFMDDAPRGGLEMSVVLEKYCRDFVYPTPFELHFSPMFLEACRNDAPAYCRATGQTDVDLAAHFTVIRQSGIAICGPAIEALFGPVPEQYYLDSILLDVRESAQRPLENPVYTVLNLCRTLAFLEEKRVLSKAQGGAWALTQINARYAPLIQAMMTAYANDKCENFDAQALKDFCRETLERIEQIAANR